ncbi:uncharacterized protein KY384_006549 [Bacidia gigantensis]|uniref:uncharacterized protein n=1 Tax=Bacidia gigantensis TaxID=2732470 RepID=UPI001D05154D|nr:uncharacterized protein KY384_006549 [Bacidia gigantensis]KAG8528860.1 hypothetical protein KY384_006549 [Bacidia gigantensis]
MIATMILLFTSYTLSFGLAFFTRSWIFHLEIIYLPHLTGSIVGLLGTISEVGIYPDDIVGGNTIAAYVLSTLSILFYALASLLTYRKIYFVRRRDAMHKDTSSSRIFTMPETEMQRQQLLRLLLSQSSPQNTPSPAKGPEATYKIHWPGISSSTARGSRRNTMSSLRNLHFSRNPRSRTSVHQLPASPGFAMSQQYQHQHHPSADRALPEVIVEEPTLSSSQSQFLRQSPLHPPTTAPINNNNNAVYNPLLPAFFDHHPGERIPSYHPRASTYSAGGRGTETLSAAQGGAPAPNVPRLPPVLGPNGYPIDKPPLHPTERETKALRHIPLDNYIVVDDEGAFRERLATGVVRRQSSGNGAGNGGGGLVQPPDTTRGIELADRGRYGTRNRPELEGDVWARI